MGTYKATRANGDVVLFESSSLDQAKADAWDSKVEWMSKADIDKMEKAAAKDAASASDDTEGAAS